MSLLISIEYDTLFMMLFLQAYEDDVKQSL
ncbi:hypothetical protein J2S08_002907 [Bacillus chungangensis]|uniref:Uncharacterized protein n=1 Tax=Bacillus chungangensis TaxID=587633 RepID=A0ABT9WUR3_9BACI|nr:hypothetical protein [Bacillus chungangensis]